MRPQPEEYAKIREINAGLVAVDEEQQEIMDIGKKERMRRQCARCGLRLRQSQKSVWFQSSRDHGLITLKMLKLSFFRTGWNSLSMISPMGSGSPGSIVPPWIAFSDSILSISQS
jgi:hypothetical protein